MSSLFFFFFLYLVWRSKWHTRTKKRAISRNRIMAMIIIHHGLHPKESAPRRAQMMPERLRLEGRTKKKKKRNLEDQEA